MVENARSKSLREADLDEGTRRAFEYIEKQVGGPIVGYEAQARWRPAWFVDVEVDGRVVPIYWRGDRGHDNTSADFDILQYEADVFQVLEANDIPVPHIYGISPDPRGIVMDRSPGRANLATAESDDERRAVLEHFMELLAKVHAIPVSDFEAIGILPPADPEQPALGDFERWVKGFRRTKQRPEPWIEFVVGWIRRSVPTQAPSIAFVTNDSGQFLFENGRVTALIDMELASLGDPLADLGGLRGRDLSEPLGDLAHGMRHYEKIAGKAVDLDVVRFHSARFQIFTPLSLCYFVQGQQPGVDLAQYHAWHIVWGRTALEAIAEILEVPLDPIEIPEPSETLRTPEHRALSHMLERLRADASDDKVAAYALDQPYRIALYLEQVDRFGAAFDEQERAEIAAILGRRIDDLGEADAELERFVLEAGPEHDPVLLRYFHRRLQREEHLYRPALREISDAVYQPIE